MLEQLKSRLIDINAFNQKEPLVIQSLLDSIPTNIPYKMKLMAVINEIFCYTSQFGIKIRHWNNSLVPVNAISFLIAESGANKDSTIKNIRKNFESSYKLIRKEQKRLATEQAIAKAEKNEEKDPYDEKYYFKYYVEPNPLFLAPSTNEGFIQHLNDIESLGLGAGYMSTSELGAELSNKDLTDNIKLVSELYDTGNKDLKALKARANQSREIKNLAVNALFMGSQDNILYDESIKKKFKVEFTTKLARRSFFVFINEKIEKEQYDSIEDILKARKSLEDYSTSKIEELDNYFTEITNRLLPKRNTELVISDEVRDLITIYQNYNERLADTIDYALPMTKLSRQHMHWKCLKLAGALCILANRSIVDEKDYLYAITYAESIFNDISSFENELKKAGYEVFVSYMHNFMENQTEISIHELIKKDFITETKKIEESINQLVKASNSYDKNAIYTQTKDGIMFNKLVATKQFGVSFKLCPGTKEERRYKASDGFQYKVTNKFEDLAGLFKNDFAFSPYQFKDGKRSNDNIISKAHWLVLDVDKSDLEDWEVHQMLSNINHIICRTSDPNNMYKFRIILETDNEFDISTTNWKKFLESIKQDLPFNIDMLAKSQIFYSYKHSADTMLCEFEAEPLVIKPHLEYASNRNVSYQSNKTNKTLEQVLTHKLDIFDYAFNAMPGQRSIKMYRAGKQLMDICRDNKIELLEARKLAKELMISINDYFIDKLDDKRLNDTLLKQIDKWEYSNEKC